MFKRNELAPVSTNDQRPAAPQLLLTINRETAHHGLA
jgi:hypothetical protein